MQFLLKRQLLPKSKTLNNFLNTIFRSLLESITEFLPVSSTGHLFLFSSFFPFENLENLEDFEDLFDIFIQSGAILSVLVIYFQFLKSKTVSCYSYLRKKTQDREGYDFVLGILVGSLPIMFFGFALKSVLNAIKSSAHLLVILATAWLIGGIIFLVVEKKFKNRQMDEASEMTVSVKHAFWIGLLQCIALIPGVSRSAATIITGRFLGYSRRTAAEYSFFLALPVLIGAGLYKLYKHRAILNSDNLGYLGLGFFLTFIFSLVVIQWFLTYIRKHGFEIFGYYRIALALIVFGYLIFQ